MSLILSLDSSTPICSAAIHNDGKLLIVGEVHEEQAHGSKLAPLIQQLFKSSGFELLALKAVAITSGPGSYTGLRIGTSTAKGLCFSLNIPLIAVDVLSVLASHVIKMGFGDKLFGPMLDARRMEVYCAIYDRELSTVSPIEARVIDQDSFSDLLDDHPIVFFGNGAEKCRGVLTHRNAVFLNNIYPSAADLGDLAFQKFQLGDFVDLVHFEPIYLKEFLVKKSTKFDSLLNK